MTKALFTLCFSILTIFQCRKATPNTSISNNEENISKTYQREILLSFKSDNIDRFRNEEVFIGHRKQISQQQHSLKIQMEKMRIKRTNRDRGTLNDDGSCSDDHCITDKNNLIFLVAVVGCGFLSLFFIIFGCIKGGKCSRICDDCCY